jgi:hypothetical protein
MCFRISDFGFATSIKIAGNQVRARKLKAEGISVEL